MVAANTIADFSASPVGVAFQAPAVANHITVGSQFNDTLTGNGVSETICGLGGGDTLKGGTGGVDDIFGGPGNDIIWGEAAGDTMLSGGPDVDAIDGDDPTNSHGGFDGADTIQGGDQNDTLRGGAGLDIIRGGWGRRTSPTRRPAAPSAPPSRTRRFRADARPLIAAPPPPPSVQQRPRPGAEAEPVAVAVDDRVVEAGGPETVGETLRVDRLEDVTVVQGSARRGVFAVRAEEQAAGTEYAGDLGERPVLQVAPGDVVEHREARRCGELVVG